MKTFEIRLGGNYCADVVVARNFEEAAKKAAKLQARYRKEDPSVSDRQMAISAIVERDDLTKV